MTSMGIFSDKRDMFDKSSEFGDSLGEIYNQNFTPDLFQNSSLLYHGLINNNQTPSLQSELNNQENNEPNNKGDFTPIPTLSSIPEKNDDSDSETTFNILNDIFNKENSEEKVIKNEKTLLNKKRSKKKIKKNKDNKKKLFKVIYPKECEKKEEKKRELSYAEKVNHNDEHDTKIPLNYYNAKSCSTREKTILNRKNEKEESKNQIEDIIIVDKKKDDVIEKSNEKNKGRNDYFFPKLCTFMTMMANKEIKKLIPDKNFKLNPPIEEISHMCVNNLYVFLYVSFKNFFIMNLEDIYEFFKLLFELDIIENFDEEKEVNLTKKQKSKAIDLLKKYNFINEESTNSDTKVDIKPALIELLKSLGYKNNNETNFKLKDKIIFLKLLNEKGIVKSRHYQEKNKEKIKTLEAQGIKLLDMTFIEFFLYFFDFSKEKDQEFLEDFEKFCNDIKESDDNFYKEKKYHLIPKVKGEKGFIHYVEDYCKLPPNKREKLKNFLKNLKGKEINIDEIKKYK